MRRWIRDLVRTATDGETAQPGARPANQAESTSPTIRQSNSAKLTSVNAPSLNPPTG